MSDLVERVTKAIMDASPDAMWMDSDQAGYFARAVIPLVLEEAAARAGQMGDSLKILTDAVEDYMRLGGAAEAMAGLVEAYKQARAALTPPKEG